jgi:hypothetical protein
VGEALTRFSPTDETPVAAMNNAIGRGAPRPGRLLAFGLLLVAPPRCETFARATLAPRWR